MQEIYTTHGHNIIKNKERLEKELKVNIGKKGNIIKLDGPAEDEYLAMQVIEAIDLGFTVEKALLLTQEDFILEKINIKDVTKRTDIARIKGRLIGTNGKTKKTIENLGDCLITIHDSTIGIIGFAEEIEMTLTAIESLIRGKKQSKVYNYMEKERIREKTKLNQDLGLKIRKKKE